MRETLARHGSVVGLGVAQDARARRGLDASGKLPKADRLEMYDSPYGSQAAVARWASTPNGNAVLQVIVYRVNLEPWRESVIRQAFGTRSRWSR